MTSGRFRAVALVVVGATAGCGFGVEARSPANPTPTTVAASTPVPTTSSTSPADFSFAAIGDFGTGEEPQRQIAQQMCRWREDHPFDVVITTGDNIYPNGAPQLFQSRFFEPMACLLDGGVKFHATLGNHDYLTDQGRPEIEEPAFGMTGADYVVRVGGVRFVLVNSNALDMEWLRAAIETEPGDLWTVVAFHHPVYSSGTNYGAGTPGFRPSLPRLFRRRGVDLVLNGHEHIYSVSDELAGIRYVVTGGGGARLYGCTERWFTDRCEVRHHFVAVEVTPASMLVKAVDLSGRRFDRFRLTQPL